MPPATLPAVPALRVLDAGTLLWRVYDRTKHNPTDFNPILSHRYFDGGRFDATEDDPYPFLYAGMTQFTAIAEVLLRDELQFENTTSRIIKRESIRHRRLVALRTVSE